MRISHAHKLAGLLTPFSVRSVWSPDYRRVFRRSRCVFSAFMSAPRTIAEQSYHNYVDACLFGQNRPDFVRRLRPTHHNSHSHRTKLCAMVRCACVICVSFCRIQTTASVPQCQCRFMLPMLRRRSGRFEWRRWRRRRRERRRAVCCDCDRRTSAAALATQMI